MSREAWGDEGDSAATDHLIEDGWLDPEAASQLRAEVAMSREYYEAAQGMGRIGTDDDTFWGCLRRLTEARAAIASVANGLEGKAVTTWVDTPMNIYLTEKNHKEHCRRAAADKDIPGYEPGKVSQEHFDWLVSVGEPEPHRGETL